MATRIKKLSQMPTEAKQNSKENQKTFPEIPVGPAPGLPGRTGHGNVRCHGRLVPRCDFGVDPTQKFFADSEMDIPPTWHHHYRSYAGPEETPQTWVD